MVLCPSATALKLKPLPTIKTKKQNQPTMTGNGTPPFSIEKYTIEKVKPKLIRLTKNAVLPVFTFTSVLITVCLTHPTVR